MSAAEELRKRVEVVDTAAADDLVALRLVFSRDEVLALADLLDATLPKPTDVPFSTAGEMERWVFAVQDLAYALEQALTRKATP